METMTEDQARKVAATLHAGQVDKVGHPYIAHLERVVHHLKSRWPDATSDEIAAAWLHDSLEDTTATRESLLEAGVSPAAVGIIETVTRPENKEYLAWIADIAAHGGISAIRVKLADNQDNRDAVRVAALPGGAERVATRYEPACRLLEAGLTMTTREL